MMKEIIKAGEQKIINAQLYPHVDLETGKIYNCEEGSKEWFHEKAHIEFNNQPLTSSLKMWQGIFSFLWMIGVTIAIVYKPFFWFALFLLALYSIIELYEEYWCNKYAKINYKTKSL